MKQMKRVTILLIVGMCLFQMSIWGADKGTFKTTPQTKNGQKWRLGYYEGGEYIDYQTTLIATVHGLIELGWIAPLEIPPQSGSQTVALWQWLAQNVQSKYLEFVSDAHYTAGWSADQRVKTFATILTRLNETKDIDLMLATGTWAGQDFANDNVDTPTLVLSSSDPLAAGIIKSVEDSGYDHLHARVDPNYYERQVRIFYDIIGFQTLGVTYENTTAGRVYAAADILEKLASELNFTLETCFLTETDIANIETAQARVIQCYQELAGKGVNAIYVTQQNGVNATTLPNLVSIFNTARIPTFSQAGADEVKAGILLSISNAAFKYVGQFHAETIAKIFNGAQPRQLDQLFEEPPKIAINLKTAEIIGYDPPVDVLGVADEIYQEITPLQP